MNNPIKQFMFNRTIGKYSPELQLALKKMASQRAQIIELTQKTEALTKKDIGQWRQAWQRAINVENPRRLYLYNIYTDVAVDLHVMGCVTQRKNMTLKTPFRVLGKDGKVNDEATKLLQSEWFDAFVSLALDSMFYGHSLIQFGEVVSGKDGAPTFDNVQLVPRQHVIPEYGVILRDQNDEISSGISYRDGDVAYWCIEVGNDHNLGIFLNCAPAALSKKNVTAFWDTFSEVFGLPIRMAHTTETGTKEREELMDMLDQMGSGFSGVFPVGTDIEIRESGRSDAFNVFDKRIDRANSELSKGILGQTMTIDSGSSYSQGQVHLEVLKDLIDSDRKMIANVVNNKLLPYMEMRGISTVSGCTFEWDETEKMSMEEKRNVEQMLLSAGYEIDPQYFADKYEIPITGKRSYDFFA